MWTKGYLKHVLPALLVKKLMAIEKGQESLSSLYDIKIMPRRGKAAAEDAKACKVTFSPLHISSLDLVTEPRNFEDWGELIGEKGAQFDPTLPVESEVAEYILIKGLGETALNDLQVEASRPKPRKRKPVAEDGSTQDGTSPPTKNPKKRKAVGDTTGVLEEDGSVPKTKRRPKKTEEQTDGLNDPLIRPVRGQSASEIVKKSGDVERPTIPARPVFRMPPSWSSLSPSSSQEAIGSTSIPDRNPLSRHSTGLATPDTTPPISRSHSGHPAFQMASTPITIELDDDDDEELPELSVFTRPNLEDSVGDEFEDDLLDDFDDDFDTLPGPPPDGDDPDLAEAIRVSLIESANGGSHNSSFVHQTMPFGEATSVETLPNPGQTGFTPASYLLDRRAIADARLAHLEKTRPAASPPLPANLVLSANALAPEQQPSSRTLEVIDLTLD